MLESLLSSCFNTFSSSRLMGFAMESASKQPRVHRLGRQTADTQVVQPLHLRHGQAPDFKHVFEVGLFALNFSVWWLPSVLAVE